MRPSPEHVDSREALASFVRSLHRGYLDDEGSWENADLGSFLEGLAGWVDDAEGWYHNADQELPANGDWAFFARALSAATVYE